MINLNRFAQCTLTLLLIFQCISNEANAQKRDTTWVQTFTFDSIFTREATFKFPPRGEKYEKVLMWYTLKCDPKTPWDKYNCGEWDYLTYTGIRDSSARFDSTRLTHPNFRLSDGSAPDVFKYASNATPSFKMKQYSTARTASLAGLQSSSAGNTGYQPYSSVASHRYRFVYSASEINAMGFTKGNINAIGIILKSGTDWATFSRYPLRIGLAKDDGQSLITSMPNSSKEYIPMMPMTENTQHFVPSSSPLAWDGESALVFDIVTNTTIPSNTIEFGTLTTNRDAFKVFNIRNKAMMFNRGDNISVPAGTFSGLSSEVTIMFWHYGSNNQPQNHNTFEARGPKGERIVNAHVPWGNKTVYWDAGNSTGYDRIEKGTDDNSIKLQWNHWAFTKNTATGSMKIYLNGKLWHSGTDKKRNLGQITDFKIGSGVDGSFTGMLDEFCVFNKELTETQIAQIMQYPKESALNSLVIRYSFDNAKDNDITVSSDNTTPVKAKLFGMPYPVNAEKTGLVFSDIFMPTSIIVGDAAKSMPSLILYKGTLPTITKDNFVEKDTIPARRISLVLFNNPANGRIIKENTNNYPTIATDTLTVYAADTYSYTYDENGKKIDSTYNTANQEIVKATKVWYSPIVNYEIWRYITPYGIGLDLGPKGFRWVYDVTDYEPLLHDFVRLYAGNTQELLDLKFLFIKGTPPRDVIAINNLWNGDRSHGSIADNKEFLPIDKVLTKTGDGNTQYEHRIKIRVSGHGFADDKGTNCAEFCPKKHFVTVNDKKFEWMLWNECATNPVYPQGGTWTLDRAGWCPGAEVPTQDFDITPFIKSGENNVLDYGMQVYDSRGAFGNYVVASQLITYTAPNFKTDASVEDIIQPNDWEFYSRMNPICNNPKIVIKNKGTNPLTTVAIEYGVKGGVKSTFNWKGNLSFLQTDTVVLPSISWGNITGKQRFEVTLRNPNGTVDENTLNDYGDVRFDAPPIMYPQFQINLKTNNQAAAQYEWYLKKADGTIIGEGSNLEDNTVYKHDYTLENGCYEFRLTNREDYGLDLWFVRDQLGSGYLRLLSDGVSIKSFEPDFGRDIFLQFIVGDKPTISSVTNAEQLSFGNVKLNETKEMEYKITPKNAAGLIVEEVSVSSLRKFYSVKSVTPSVESNNPRTLAFGDTMTIIVAFKGDREGKHNGNLIINSNDQKNQAFSVPLTASIGTTSVNDMVMENDLILEIQPNPNDGNGVITFGNMNGIETELRVSITDLLGNEIIELTTEKLAGNVSHLQIPSHLPNGTYRVLVSTPYSKTSKQFVILK
ncbi:MAG: T9SS type A sorting domain-containing protein [Ignavibacteria bacterium]|nr:T9SS type A sorting domain-containing protein [Ignavibacteria bacterium]